MKSTLSTKNLILSQPTLNDLSAIKDFEDRNRHHLKKWEFIDENILERLINWIKECEEGKSVRLMIRLKDGKFIGFCNFTQIYYGAFQACYLGYKIDHQYEGKGLMTEALNASINYIFENLNLHRIMANYMPINTRSEKLLQKLGFNVEGYAKNYLLINGKWEDHILTALSVEKWQNLNNLKLTDQKKMILI